MNKQIAAVATSPAGPNVVLWEDLHWTCDEAPDLADIANDITVRLPQSPELGHPVIRAVQAVHSVLGGKTIMPHPDDVQDEPGTVY